MTPDLGRCRPGSAESFTMREASCESSFTDRKRQGIDTVSDNEYSGEWELSHFPWCESGRISAQIRLADLHSTAFRLFGRAVSQDIFQHEHGQSQANLLGLDSGSALLYFGFPVGQVR